MQNNGGACRPAGAGGGLPVPGLLIGLSSPRLARGWKAGWLQAGQAEGRPMGAQCGGEMDRAGSVIVPVQTSQQDQTHSRYTDLCPREWQC